MDIYDYGPRLYFSNVGRWLSPDPSLSDRLNRYAYVQNRPVELHDLTGFGSDSQDEKVWALIDSYRSSAPECQQRLFPDVSVDQIAWELPKRDRGIVGYGLTTPATGDPSLELKFAEHYLFAYYASKHSLLQSIVIPLAEIPLWQLLKMAEDQSRRPLPRGQTTPGLVEGVFGGRLSEPAFGEVTWEYQGVVDAWLGRQPSPDTPSGDWHTTYCLY